MKPFLMLILIGFLIQSHPFPIDATAKNKESYKKVEQIEMFINQSLWAKASIENNELEKWFKKSEWKLQLLGDEEEYDGIERDIQKLKSSIEEKDATQSKVIISELKVRLKNIYSF